MKPQWIAISFFLLLSQVGCGVFRSSNSSKQPTAETPVVTPPATEPPPPDSGGITPFKIPRDQPVGSQPSIYWSTATAVFFKTSYVTPTSMVTDGTATGTIKVSEAGTSLPADAVFRGAFSGVSYFYSASNKKVWRSDSTVAGTYELIASPDPGIPGGFGNPIQSVVVGGQMILFWTGTDPNTSTLTLYETNGTVAGTRARAFPTGKSPTYSKGLAGEKWLFIDTNYSTSPASVDIHAYDFNTHAFSILTTIASINPGSGGYQSSGGKLYFTLHVSGVGNYIYATNGTSAGTYRLSTTVMMDGSLKYIGKATSGKEIFIGQPTSGGGGTYRFYTTEGTSTSDFTEIHDTTLNLSAYTYKVDFVAAFGSEFVVRFYASNRKSDATVGGIWTTDGTSAGTSQIGAAALMDPASTATVSRLKPFEFNGALYFQGYDSTNGVELWKYDGVGAPAVLADLNPGVGNGLQTEGYGPLSDAAVTATYFVIPAATGSSGFEPVRSDGTSSGTFVLKDIYPGTGSSITGTGAYSIAAIGNKVIFAADDKVHGNEFWITDGSTSGTQVLKLIDQSYGPSSLSSFQVLGGKLYFTANDGVHGVEPWVSDGTTAGTQMIADLTTGANGSASRDFVRLNNVNYFLGSDVGTPTNGFISLWKTDGTSVGTVKVGDQKVMSGSALKASTSLLYFVGKESTNGAELWKSDGTTHALIKDIKTGTGGAFGSYTSWFYTMGSKVFFDITSPNTTLFAEPWVSDGTNAGTFNLGAFYPYAYDGSTPEGSVEIAGTMFFMAYDDNARWELFKTDGTTLGTGVVKDIHPTGSSIGSGDDLFDSINSKLIFAASDGTNGRELWVSDGTSSGTVMLADITGGSGSTTFSAFAKDSTHFYIFAQPSGGSWQLWKTDGTVSGTSVVFTSSSGESPGASMLAAGNYLFFSYCDTAHGCELWRSDKASNHELFVDLNPGANSTTVKNLIHFQNSLFFAGSYNGSDVIWKTGIEEP